MKVSKVKTRNRWNGNQRRIGITGGIASGKSSIAKYLETSKNFPILDADLFAREALTKNSKIILEVLGRYGEQITKQKDCKEEINRLVLGEIIFSDKKEKLWLESLIHPFVRKRFDEELSKLRYSPKLALVIPLLFEANLHDICSEIWLIYCTIEQQYERLKLRNNFNDKQSKLRIESQLPIDHKRQLSDIIIDNSGTIQSSYDQIDTLLN